MEELSNLSRAWIKQKAEEWRICSFFLCLNCLGWHMGLLLPSGLRLNHLLPWFLGLRTPIALNHRPFHVSSLQTAAHGTSQLQLCLSQVLKINHKSLSLSGESWLKQHVRVVLFCFLQYLMRCYIKKSSLAWWKELRDGMAIITIITSNVTCSVSDCRKQKWSRHDPVTGCYT